MKMRKKKTNLCYYKSTERIQDSEDGYIDVIDLLNKLPYLVFISGCANTILAGWELRTDAITSGELATTDMYKLRRLV